MPVPSPRRSRKLIAAGAVLVAFAGFAGVVYLAYLDGAGAEG
jgi:hypothetical protein